MTRVLTQYRHPEHPSNDCRSCLDCAFFEYDTEKMEWSCAEVSRTSKFDQNRPNLYVRDCDVYELAPLAPDPKFREWREYMFGRFSNTNTDMFRQLKFHLIDSVHVNKVLGIDQE